MKLCLDAYALVEIAQANPAFTQLLNSDFVITEPTLAEFYGVLYRKAGKEHATYWLVRLEPWARSVPLSIMVKAAEFKVHNARRNVSFFDCAGYLYAQENGMRFVTGDKEFKDKDGVLFIK